MREYAGVSAPVLYDGRIPLQPSCSEVSDAAFSDALASVRQHLWEAEYFSTSTPDPDRVESPRVYLKGLIQSARYTH